MALKAEKMDFSQEKLVNFWSRRKAHRKYTNILIILRLAEPRGRVKGGTQREKEGGRRKEGGGRMEGPTLQ